MRKRVVAVLLLVMVSVGGILVWQEGCGGRQAAGVPVESAVEAEREGGNPEPPGASSPEPPGAPSSELTEASSAPMEEENSCETAGRSDEQSDICGDIIGETGEEGGADDGDAGKGGAGEGEAGERGAGESSADAEDAGADGRDNIMEEAGGDGVGDKITPVPQHEYEKLYVMNTGPTCQSHGYYNMICARCGEYGGDGVDPALPHTPDEGTVINEGNCNSERIVQYHCVYCGCPCGEERCYVEGAHHFVEKVHTYWDEEALQVLSESVMQCENGCGTILTEEL